MASPRAGWLRFFESRLDPQHRHPMRQILAGLSAGGWVRFVKTTFCLVPPPSVLLR